MQLSTYMKERGIDDDAMASLIGDCSASAVRKWKYGERVPRPNHLRRIVEATEGAVTANDFFGSPDDGDANGAA